MNKKIFTDEQWKKMTADPDTIFCPAPFNSYYIHPNGGLGACCVHKSGLREGLETIKGNTNDAIIETYNSESFKKLRKDFIEGVKNPECHYCWKGQEIGAHTMRHAMLDWMHKWGVGEAVRNSINEDYSVTEPEIHYLDARLDNNCNLKCRSCGPEYSTTWYPESAELKEMGDGTSGPNYNLPELKRFYEAPVGVEALKKNIPSLRRIYFAGGEPLIMPQHYEILDQLLELGMTNIDMFYNTNFSKLTQGRYDAVAYWKKFTNVTVTASLDGNHQRAEYARKNLNWSKVIENRQRMIEEVPHVKFMLGPTLSIYTAYNIVDFHREWTELGYIKPWHMIVNVLHGPENLCISNLPDHHKQRLTRLYHEHIEWLETFREDARQAQPWDPLNRVQDQTVVLESVIRGFQAAINQLQIPAKPADDPGMIMLWGKEMWLDRKRNENLFEVFPEYADMKEQWSRPWPQTAKT